MIFTQKIVIFTGVLSKIMDDYIAELHHKGMRKTFYENRPKIEFVFKNTMDLLKKGTKNCEIGIGAGILLRLIDDMGEEITGLDISNYLIEELKAQFAQEHRKIVLYQANITQDLGVIGKFNNVYCLDILEHVEDITKAVDNIHKMLTDEGNLIITLPWKENFGVNLVICPDCGKKFHRLGHFHHFQKIEDIKKIISGKFKIFDLIFMDYSYNLLSKVELLFKKTIFKRKYYDKNGMPKYKTTVLIKCRKIN